MSFVATVEGWELRTDVSSEWLFVVLAQRNEAPCFPTLAEAVWDLAAARDIRRLVIELAPETLMTSFLIGQLVLLHKRCHLEGGVLRMCGLSETNHTTLALMRLADRFPNYADREAAVMGYNSDDAAF